MKEGCRSFKRVFLLALILAFVMSFVFFVAEPITMYAGNIDDFWFDFYILIKPVLLSSVVFFVVIFSLLILASYLEKRLKKPGLFPILFSFFFCLLLVAYIHSNFLAGFLPPLDGTKINWNEFLPNLISIVVTLAIIVGIIIGYRKCGSKKAVKYFSYVSLAILAMSAVSLFSIFLTTPVLEKKDILIATNKNLTSLSKDENYIVLLVDAVDQRIFSEVLDEKEENKQALKDFRYFPDTISGYPFTRDSIPFIFSGTWNNNEKPFADYSTEAYDNSAFFEKLNQNFELKNFYDNDFVWHSQKALEFDNVAVVTKAKTVPFIKQELKYLLFKFLPYPLKRFSKVDKMKFDLAQRNDEYGPFDWDERLFYDQALNTKADVVDDKLFSYIHLEGAHVPLNLDEDVKTLEDGGTYHQKVQATMTVIKKYLQYLKDNNVYDNSTIVILADHGYDIVNDVAWNRQNPILLVKGFNEKHSQLKYSEKQISHEDLCQMLIDLLDKKKSDELFSEVPEDGRIRKYIYYGYNYEDHMTENETSGKAWETDKLKPTGREFNL